MINIKYLLAPSLFILPNIHLLFLGPIQLYLQSFSYVFLLCLSLLLLIKTKYKQKIKYKVSLLIAFLVILIAVFNTYIFNTNNSLDHIKYIVVITIYLILTYSLIYKFGKDKAIELIFNSLSMFIVTICLLLAFSINNINASEHVKVDNFSRLGLFFKLDISRKLPPLTYGFNYIGIIASISLIENLYNTFKNKYSLKVFLFKISAILSALIIIFICDSKLSFAYALSLTFIFLLPYNISFSRSVLITILMAPLFLFFIFYNIDLSYLTSEYSGNIGTLTHRTEFWTETIRFLKNFEFQHIFGYGFYSHKVTELNLEFNSYTTGNRNPKYLNIHNNFLQTVLDFGYFGFTVLYFIYIRSLIVLRKTQTSSSNVSYICMLFIYLNGFSEAVPNIYNREILFIAIALILFASTQQEKYKN